MQARRLIRLLRYALPYRGQWIVICLATLVGCAMTMLQPWPMKILVDHVLQTSELRGPARQILAPFADSQTALLLIVVGGGLFVFVVNAISDVLLTRAWVRVGQGMVWSLAADLYARIQRRSIVFHTRNPVGDSMTRIAGDSWCANTLIDTLLFAPITALVMLIVLLVVMFRMDPALTVLALAVAPFMAGGAWLMSGPIGALAKARRELDSQMQSHVQQTLAGVPVVQAFTQERREHERFKKLADDVIAAHRRSAWINGLNDLTSGLITTIGTVAVLLVGGHRVLAGSTSVGSLFVFLGYLGTLQTQFRVLASAYTGLHALRASSDRVLEVLELEPEVRDRPNARPLPNVNGHVRIEHITVGYDPARPPVLRDISLEARPGELIAIVGPTGAGKSTLANLIPRLLDPWDGRVMVDGNDLRDVRLTDLRRNVAMVLQEPVLFPISIAENIAYGRPNATQHQIAAAAQAANAHLFIGRLEHGFDTIVGERGATLSGGERQRIAVARALLIDAPILVLDEPTSNLDSMTEGALMEAIERLMHGRTTLLIAHRLSTVQRADRIVVIEQGAIVERGTHHELISHAGGAYARLCAAQDALQVGAVDSPAVEEVAS